MTKLTVLRGYSASGKSTWARAQTANIVSRDAIRGMLTGTSTKFAGDNAFEQTVTKIEEATVKTLLGAGQDVIIDDTNLVLKFARHWVDLAVQYGAEWEVKDFQPEPQVCQERNSLRGPDRVHMSVLDSQIKRFPYKNWLPVVPSVTTSAVTPYVPDASLPTAFGFDLDGTLAHSTGRNPYDPTRYHEDVLDPVVGHLARVLWDAGHQIIIFSGRSEEYRDVCERWLITHGVVYNKLVMRAIGDKRNDAIVKSELFDNEIAPHYNFIAQFDDRNRVVDALRAKGIKVLAVAEGNF